MKQVSRRSFVSLSTAVAAGSLAALLLGAGAEARASQPPSGNGKKPTNPNAPQPPKPGPSAKPPAPTAAAKKAPAPSAPAPAATAAKSAPKGPSKPPSKPSKPGKAVPEFDAKSLGAGLALLVGGLLVLGDRGRARLAAFEKTSS